MCACAVQREKGSALFSSLLVALDGEMVLSTHLMHAGDRVNK
jgi:hypothetical protein